LPFTIIIELKVKHTFHVEIIALKYTQDGMTRRGGLLNLENEDMQTYNIHVYILMRKHGLAHRIKSRLAATWDSEKS
jgi:hypothetical protein